WFDKINPSISDDANFVNTLQSLAEPSD
ncbi:hypothetical protein ECPA23_2970, partial [Escherichia coli PA23]